MDAGVRVLVLSVDVGESHAAMAQCLAGDLRRRDDVARVEVRSGFEMLGAALGALLPRGFEFHLGRVKWSYDLAYRLFSRVSMARRCGEWALYRLGGAELLRTIEAHRPDVVVSTYPVLNPILSRLRSAGRLDRPVAAVVGPLGGLSFWVQPAIDLHLLLYPEAGAEAQRLAGPLRTRTVRPLVAPAFLAPGAAPEARAQLESHLRAPIDPGRRLIVVSGGGWGAGDLTGAVKISLEIPGTQVIAVCGRNEEQRRRLQEAFAGEPNVIVLGFTDLMPTLLAAADAFVTATAGISCLEARMSGCPTVCFGFAFGHVRDNTRALAEHGFARAAAGDDQLRHELEAALERGREQPPSWLELPTAAEVIVRLAHAGSQSGEPRVREAAPASAVSC